MKYHKMRQIMNVIYLLFLRIMNLASFFEEKIFWSIVPPLPSSRPSIKALIMSSLIFLVSQGGGGETYFDELLMALYFF